MTTATTVLPRPAAGEYAPYYEKYIALVPDGDLVSLLAEQMGDTLALLESVSAERSLHRYAPDKWSIRDLVQHVADSERIFAYRALRIARGDASPLAGFDENRYAAAARADERDWLALIAELEAVRTATVALFRGLGAEALARRGSANNVEVTARALAWIIAGHERHHVGILRERYL